MQHGWDHDPNKTTGANRIGSYAKGASLKDHLKTISSEKKDTELRWSQMSKDQQAAATAKRLEELGIATSPTSTATGLTQKTSAIQTSGDFDYGSGKTGTSAPKPKYSSPDPKKNWADLRAEERKAEKAKRQARRDRLKAKKKKDAAKKAARPYTKPKEEDLDAIFG